MSTSTNELDRDVGAEWRRQLAVPGAGSVFATTKGPLGWAIARLVGVRPGHGPVSLRITSAADSQNQTWIRSFDGRVRTSRVQVEEGGDLIETIGPLSLRFSLQRIGVRTVATLERVGIGQRSVSVGDRLTIVCSSLPPLSSADRHHTTVRIVVGRRPIGAVTYRVSIEVGT